MSTEIMVRVSPEVLSKIDELVTSGRFDSRADVCRTATIHMLRDMAGESQSRETIISAINEGHFDDALDMRVRKIFADILEKGKY